MCDVICIVCYTQQTWSGFSPSTVRDSHCRSGLSPTTFPEMSTKYKCKCVNSKAEKKFEKPNRLRSLAKQEDNLKRVDNVNRWKHIGFSNFLKIPQIMFEMVPNGHIWSYVSVYVSNLSEKHLQLF